MSTDGGSFLMRSTSCPEISSPSNAVGSGAACSLSARSASNGWPAARAAAAARPSVCVRANQWQACPKPHSQLRSQRRSAAARSRLCEPKPEKHMKPAPKQARASCPCSQPRVNSRYAFMWSWPSGVSSARTRIAGALRKSRD